ncbi:uncharacterized protein LOC101896546 [Musca domestica]|uniref:Uncharacterized protein LOC101896546 n=1 Tax=Musca domestica TaxID=7370 RepID=A0A1I8NF41_MUSDO|nr:uncharacterized protein LOC101896546 [Musca domestica]
MSYIGNISDIECEKSESNRIRTSNLVTKAQANKLSSEPKWTTKRGPDSDSEVSTTDNFLTKGAFLLTPSYELSMERAAQICEKITFKGCFSLTKTASGILFKFSHPDDFQAVYKKGFHKVTGARFYRKIAIPCRPRKTFTLFVLDVPEDLPVEDIRHALYKFDSVVEVVRLHLYHQTSSSLSPDKNIEGASPPTKGEGSEKNERTERKELPPAVIRITLASMDEYNILVQNGLNFYDATFFPTETNISLKGAKIENRRRMMDGSVSGRVRELLPVFDAAGFCKLPPPTRKVIKPPRS